MLKRVLPIVLALMFTACGTSPLHDDGPNSVGETLDKAWADTKAEGKRFNDSINDSKQDGLDSLADANHAFNDEEHRFNQRVKDTGAKANSDVLDEEARTTGRVKDTLAKANMDAVEEEHLFNDRFKTTSKKTNMDIIAEGDKLTDRIVGSDDKTVDQHGDDIRDLQRRMALVEQMNQAQDALLALYLQQMQAGDAQSAADIFDLRTDLGSLTGRMETAESDISVLQTLSSGLRTDLTVLQGRVDLAERDIIDNANAINDLYDQINEDGGILDRLIVAEIDIVDLNEQTKKLRKRLKKLKNYVTGCLESRIDALETAVNASCTLSVSNVTSFPVSKCTNVIGWGFCGVNQSRTLYSAQLTLQCLDKEPQHIDNVLFETNPN